MSDSYFNSPSALLAVAFPPRLGLRGACSTLVDLARHRPQLMTRREAARHIFRRNMEYDAAYGKGNRAKRRARSLRLARSASYHDLPLVRPNTDT